MNENNWPSNNGGYSVYPWLGRWSWEYKEVVDGFPTRDDAVAAALHHESIHASTQACADQLLDALEDLSAARDEIKALRKRLFRLRKKCRLSRVREDRDLQGTCTAQEVEDRNRPWEVDFDHWAQFDRDRLLSYLLDQKSGIGLTFAAETACKTDDPRLHAAVVKLLDHPKAVVREGALIGLGHLSSPIAAAMEKLRQMAAEDPSEVLREAAASLIEAWRDKGRLAPVCLCPTASFPPQEYVPFYCHVHDKWS